MEVETQPRSTSQGCLERRCGHKGLAGKVQPLQMEGQRREAAKGHRQQENPVGRRKGDEQKCKGKGAPQQQTADDGRTGGKSPTRLGRGL